MNYKYLLILPFLCLGCSNVNRSSSVNCSSGPIISSSDSSSNHISSFKSSFDDIITSSSLFSSISSIDKISSSSSSFKPESTTSSFDKNTSNITSSSSPLISSSDDAVLNNIKSIKDKAQEFIGLENNVGVYESNIEVKINLELLACLDAVTTKTGYGDRYKILMTDGDDYIYLKTTYENYDYLKKYVNNYGEYEVNGYISLYNNEVELTVKEKPRFLDVDNIKVAYSSLGEMLSLSEIYSDINKLKLNTKGIAFSKIIKTELVCLAKDINNTNLYFGNGDYIINVHGHDKVTNKFIVGNSYLIVGALSMHNFRPGLEFVYSYSLEKNIEFSTENATTITAKSLYNYTYKVDDDSSYPNYTNLFKKPYKITGYLNSYLKDNKEYLVFEDEYNANYYSTYQNALNKKAIFFINENYIALNSNNINYCPIYEHLESGTKLDIIIFPYLWNTQKYPQIYCYDFEIGK